MSYFSDWSDVLTGTIQNLWFRFVSFIPELVGALVVLVVGFAIAFVLGRFVKKVLDTLKVDSILEKSGVDKKFDEVGVHLSISGLVGWFVKWFLVLAVLITAADILGWQQINQFLNEVAFYIPNVIIAVAILAVGMVAGQFTQGIVEKTIHASKIHTWHAATLGAVGKWSVIVFAFLVALSQLGVTTRFIEIVFTGVVATLVIAFGLAGKDKAKEFIDELDKMNR